MESENLKPVCFHSGRWLLANLAITSVFSLLLISIPKNHSTLEAWSPLIAGLPATPIAILIFYILAIGRYNTHNKDHVPVKASAMGLMTALSIGLFAITLPIALIIYVQLYYSVHG